MNQAIFRILSYLPDKDVFAFNGSAFFIDDKGSFISAGHNFCVASNTYKAFIDDNYYGVETIYHEYMDHDGQQPPLYLDLYIGKVVDFRPVHFTPLAKDAKINSKDKLTAVGFSTKNVPEPGKLDDLYDDDFYSSRSNTDSEDRTKIRTRHYGEMAVTFGGKTFLHIDKYREKREIFENGFTISLPISEPHGYSGGPILIKDKAIGMLIGENGAIGADYIIKKFMASQEKQG